MYTIKSNESEEIVIKNSKFIGIIYNVEDEVIINSILEKLRKKYKDATHITYAWKLKDRQKCTDDGEPSGTAGAPIMEVINKNDLINVLVVVIRYFGGIKLGAGGLIRAYSKACREVLNKCILTEYIRYNYYKVSTDYDNLKLLNKLTSGLEIESKKFDKDIIYEIKVKEEEDNIISLLDNENVKIEKIDK